MTARSCVSTRHCHAVVHASHVKREPGGCYGGARAREWMRSRTEAWCRTSSTPKNSPCCPIPQHVTAVLRVSTVMRLPDSTLRTP
eukprot:2326245-Rhodomonas_salina.2